MARLNETRVLGGVIADAFAVRASTGTASTLHAQHGAGIFIGLDGDVTVIDPAGRPVRGRVVVIPPDRLHAAVSPGPTLGLLYDPEVAPHVDAYARLRGGAFAVEGRAAAHLCEAMTAHRASLDRPEVLDGIAREAAARLAPAPARRRGDGRVARVLEALRDPTRGAPLDVARLGISPAHLQSLFVREVGLPIRTFRLWRRLLVAVAAFARLDATSAAHLAGFADLAHFSRTCRRMLGYAPTTLRGGGLQT